MKLLLIRHGETVDNVAQLYAGVRNSALTVQGVLQAERLGQHLAASGIRYTHIFASDLQRAVKTAQALLSAQPEPTVGPGLSVCQLPILREQDFGFYEGKSFYARQRDSNKSGKDNHRSQHEADPDFKDVESKDSMTKRTDTFVAEYLRPLIVQPPPRKDTVVAIISHGILLSHLWRSILSMFAKQTVSLTPGLAVGGEAVPPLEYLGGWSNTGYLEVDITIPSVITETSDGDLQPGHAPSSSLPSAIKMLIRTVNGKEHLKGLKRARGVGSSQYDEGQKKIESFFKKTKLA
ncbi:MAG: hypothetical protein Q9184_001565 [Pyrenodesmia sp. 2 TL-2023]